MTATGKLQSVSFRGKGTRRGVKVNGVAKILYGLELTKTRNDDHGSSLVVTTSIQHLQARPPSLVFQPIHVQVRPPLPIRLVSTGVK